MRVHFVFLKFLSDVDVFLCNLCVLCFCFVIFLCLKAFNAFWSFLKLLMHFEVLFVNVGAFSLFFSIFWCNLFFF